MQELLIMLVPSFILSFFLYKERDRNDREVNRLLNELEAYRKAMLARNLTEYAAAEYMSKPEEMIETPDDIMESTELDDNQFKNMISKAGEEEITVEI